MDTTTRQNVSLTKLFYDTAVFIFHHLPAMLVAVGLPLVASYAVVWITAGAVVAELKSASSFDEAAAIFNFTSPTSYTLILVALIVLAINIIGWVAGPLVVIKQGQIKFKQIFKESLQYFRTFFALSLMIALAGALCMVVAFLVILIVITLAGFFDQNAIALWEGILIAFVPDTLIILMSIFFLFAPYYVIDKQLPAWPAVLASMGLVRKHFFTITVRFLLIAVMVLIAAFIIELIPIFGGTLAYIMSIMIMIVYTYYMYKGLTSTTTD